MAQIKYRELRGYKYQLVQSYVHPTGICGATLYSHPYLRMFPDGTLIMLANYAWDGPSGPTYDSKSSLRASLVHDALYQLMKMGILDYDTHRQRVDELLRDIAIEDGMWKARAWAWYYAVRLAGRIYSQGNGKPADDPILTAP